MLSLPAESQTEDRALARRPDFSKALAMVSGILISKPTGFCDLHIYTGFTRNSPAFRHSGSWLQIMKSWTTEQSPSLGRHGRIEEV